MYMLKLKQVIKTNMQLKPIQVIDKKEQAITNKIMKTYAQAKEATTTYYLNEGEDRYKNKMITIEFQNKISTLFAEKQAYLNAKALDEEAEQKEAHLKRIARLKRVAKTYR